MIELSHDPFARTTLMRQLVMPLSFGDCDWCGQHRHRNGEPLSGLFQYGTRRDDNGRVNWHDGLFCGKSCFESY